MILRYKPKLNYLLYISILAFSISIFSSCDELGLTNNKIKTKNGWKEFIVNETGDSVMIYYDKKKRIIAKYTFKNGYKHGPGYTYYDNGNIHFSLNYNDGFQHGVTKWFFENGKLYRETNYIKGKREGIEKKYYDNGKLLAEIPYKNNKVQAGLKEYLKDGSINKDLPKIIIKEEDKTVFENKIILIASLAPRAYKRKYSIVKSSNGHEYNLSLKNETKGGKAYIEYALNPGGVLMKKVKIRASAKTSLGNPIVLYKTYNLVAENKM